VPVSSGREEQVAMGCVDGISTVFYVGEDVGPACESGVIDWSLAWGQASQEVRDVSCRPPPFDDKRAHAHAR